MQFSKFICLALELGRTETRNLTLINQLTNYFEKKKIKVISKGSKNKNELKWVSSKFGTLNLGPESECVDKNQIIL